MTTSHITDFAPYSIFGLEVAFADRLQRKTNMRGQRAPGARNDEQDETVKLYAE